MSLLKEDEIVMRQKHDGAFIRMRPCKINHVTGAYEFIDDADANKATARAKIRAQKSLEDDLVDTKILLQFLIYGVVDIYSVLTPEQKLALAYDDNLSAFTAIMKDPNNLFRVDVETDQLARISKIVTDELTFANIAKTEYIDKKAL